MIRRIDGLGPVAALHGGSTRATSQQRSALAGLLSAGRFLADPITPLHAACWWHAPVEREVTSGGVAKICTQIMLLLLCDAAAAYICWNLHKHTVQLQHINKAE
jgi:hypothetical protein